ncbi:MAG: DUF5627 domain-containing protein [Prolixibacteraceae bacterium]
MKIKYIFSLLIGVVAVACSNSDWDFPDYEVQGCYFPYQTPARTLILGKYDQGINENDNKHCFDITALLTGIYENTEERSVYFAVDKSLLDNVENVKALPEEYYTIETSNPAIISVGDTKARIRVQLNDKFFEDELSFGAVNTTNYVIPMVITQVENIDSLFTGISYSDYAKPDRLNPLHWDVRAKDYTLFGIKYMNRFHGNYLRRGKDMITGNTPMLAREYNAEYTEYDEVVFVETTGFNTVKLQNIIGRGDNSSPGNVTMELVFNNDNTCSVRSFEGDVYDIKGTGKFTEDGDAWGGKSKDVIYLDYIYTDAANSETHAVKDTLVIRDRMAVFEEFTVVLKE